MKPLRGTELKRFLREARRPRRELVLVLADVEDPVNVGAAFRTADACRVDRLVLAGITPRPPHKLISKVGRKKDERVPWSHAEDAAAALDALRAEGFEVVAIEITAEARPIHLCEFPEKVALVVGHEDHGIPRKVLERCDSAAYLPMYGKGASLNVSVALGIACFQALHGPARPAAVAGSPVSG